ncbi:YesL family protein [Salipaludibacillus neizhouensis]|nr:YesL family protein [Salipaludibacillus neizhouensis]
MESTGVVGGIYKVCEWIMKLAYINILWGLFSLLGLVIFGFFPATVAMFTLIRKLLSNEDVPTFRTFWTTYKKEFKKSNSLGLVLVIIGFIFYIDLEFLRQSTGFLHLLYIPFLIMSLVYILIVLYIFPVYVHYDLKLLQVIKNAFFIMLLYPIYTIIAILISLVALYLMIKIPSLIVLFSGSIFSLIIMSCANLSFNKNDEKLQKSVQKVY